MSVKGYLWVRRGHTVELGLGAGSWPSKRRAGAEPAPKPTRRKHSTLAAETALLWQPCNLAVRSPHAAVVRAVSLSHGLQNPHLAAELALRLLLLDQSVVEVLVLSSFSSWFFAIRCNASSSPRSRLLAPIHRVAA